MWSPSRLVWLILLALSLALHTARAPGQSVARRQSEPQFLVRSSLDPRIVQMLRRGAGPERKAEFAVFELVDKGTRLRLLHKTVLRNDEMPLVWFVPGKGRFLITMDDRKGTGTGAHCLVVHDLALGTSRAWKLDEMLSPTEIDRLHTRSAWPGGKHWCAAWPWYDPERLLFFTASPENCKADGLPFLVVDLRSQSAEVRIPPPRFDPAVITTQQDGRVAWTLFDEDKDPDPLKKAALPVRLRAKPLPNMAADERKELGLADEEATFSLTPDGTMYLRSAPAERGRQEEDGTKGTK